MGKRKYRDIKIRGVVYPTAQAAALALGVQAQTVQIALRAGTLDRVGLRQTYPRPMPICIRGVTYETARDAAKKLRVPLGTIYTALARGTQDKVGLKRPYNGARSQAFVIGGLRFSSLASASRALGFGSGYVSLAQRRGSKAMLDRVMAAAMQLQARQEEAERALRLRHAGIAA